MDQKKQIRGMAALSFRAFVKSGEPVGEAREAERRSVTAHLWHLLRCGHADSELELRGIADARRQASSGTVMWPQPVVAKWPTGCDAAIHVGPGEGRQPLLPPTRVVVHVESAMPLRAHRESILKGLAEFFDKHYPWCSPHQVRFNEEPLLATVADGVGDLADSVHANRRRQSAMVVTVRHEGGATVLDVAYWGVGDNRDMSRSRVTVPDCFMPGSTSYVIEFLIKVLACRFTDAVAWTRWGCAPQLPSLIAGRVLWLDDEQIAGEYSDYAAAFSSSIASCPLYYPLDYAAMLRFAAAVDVPFHGSAVLEAVIAPFCEHGSTLSERLALFRYAGPEATLLLADFCHVHREHYGLTAAAPREVLKTWCYQCLTDMCRVALVAFSGGFCSLDWQAVCRRRLPAFVSRCREIAREAVERARGAVSAGERAALRDDVHGRFRDLMESEASGILLFLRQRSFDVISRRVGEEVTRQYRALTDSTAPFSDEACLEVLDLVSCHLSDRLAQGTLSTHFRKRYDTAQWGAELARYVVLAATGDAPDYCTEDCPTESRALCSAKRSPSPTKPSHMAPEDIAICREWQIVKVVAEFYASNYLDSSWSE